MDTNSVGVSACYFSVVRAQNVRKAIMKQLVLTMMCMMSFGLTAMRSKTQSNLWNPIIRGLGKSAWHAKRLIFGNSFVHYAAVVRDTNDCVIQICDFVARNIHDITLSKDILLFLHKTHQLLSSEHKQAIKQFSSAGIFLAQNFQQNERDGWFDIMQDPLTYEFDKIVDDILVQAFIIAQETKKKVVYTLSVFMDLLASNSDMIVQDSAAAQITVGLITYFVNPLIHFAQAMNRNPQTQIDTALIEHIYNLSKQLTRQLPPISFRERIRRWFT